MSVPWCLLMSALLLYGASSDDSVADSDACPAQNLWADLLEEWATSAQDSGGRHGRVMALPPTKGYYVTERIDGPLTPPPPPPHGSHHNGPHGPQPGAYGPHGPQSGPYGPAVAAQGPQSYGPSNHGPSQGTQLDHSGSQSSNGPQAGPHSGHAGSQAHGPHMSHGPQHHPQQPAPSYSQYDEWKATPPPPPGASKIVNRPPNPYKDKFKPSYQIPNKQPNQPIPVQSWPVAADRVDPPPPKQVSETDLYLLTAIEKLVYRADLMEKRLRKLEDSVHYLVAGKETKQESCANDFTRVGSACYQLSTEAGDWKAANLRCRKLRAHLLELTSSTQKRALYATLLGNEQYKGKDFWTGGLNPGLLWIWAHSARPVNGTDGADNNDVSTVVGAGRCLALVHDAATATYVYRGQDCALRHRYICELPEDREKVSNEIERVARELRRVGSTGRTGRMLGDDGRQHTRHSDTTRC